MAVITLARRTLGTSRDFERSIKALAIRHKKRFIDKYRQKLTQLLNDLKRQTPVDTGAAKGVPGPRPLYRQHPATILGMTIGNNVGETGWQIVEVQETNGNVRFTIVNPMWDYYLKFIEFGNGHHHNHPKRGFVRETWNNFKANKL